MKKRKSKSKTLTKIHPNTLKLKPACVSQYAACNGRLVTTAINPIPQPPAPQQPAPQPPALPVDSLGFDLDLENFNGEHSEEDIDLEDVSRAYYVTRVCSYYQVPRFETNH